MHGRGLVGPLARDRHSPRRRRHEPAYFCGFEGCDSGKFDSVTCHFRANRTLQENGEELREIGSLIDAGKVKPKISKVFDFHEVRSAHEYVEKGDTEGKVVLKVAD